MRARSLAALCAGLAARALLDAPSAAFVKYGQSWPTTNATIPMHLQLGSSSGALINGCSNWGCAAERALGDGHGNAEAMLSLEDHLRQGPWLVQGGP